VLGGQSRLLRPLRAVCAAALSRGPAASNPSLSSAGARRTLRDKAYRDCSQIPALAPYSSSLEFVEKDHKCAAPSRIPSRARRAHPGSASPPGAPGYTIYASPCAQDPARPRENTMFRGRLVMPRGGCRELTSCLAET
jgi:hypothetical protein